MRYNSTMNQQSTFKEHSSVQWLITGLFLAITVAVAMHHEPWFDEAQAWLLVRDLSLWDLLAHYLRYEGHPALWYLVLWLPVHLGMPYQWLPLIPVTIAVFTTWLVLRYAPFPPFITWMIPFGYFFVYQYAIIARNYVLIPPVLFGLAILYEKRLKRMVLFLVLITLLMHISLHGTIIAVGLGLAEFANATWWPNADMIRHRRFSRWFLVIIAVNSILLYAQLSFPNGLIYTCVLETNLFQTVNYSMTGITVVSVLFWLVIVAWLFRQKALLIYFFPFTGLLMLFSQVYKIWHEGILFVLLVFVLWVSYSSVKESDFAPGKADRWFRVAFLVAFACTLSIHLIWGVRALQYDWHYAYSGSKSCAQALKRNGLDNGELYMIGYNTISVQPYFNKNIFVNNSAPGKGAFWYWSMANPLARAMATMSTSRPIKDLTARAPRYALVGVTDEESRTVLAKILAETTYSIKSSFKGTIGWKGDPFISDDLYLLEKGK